MGGRGSTSTGILDTSDPKHMGDTSSTSLRKKINKASSTDEKNKITQDWINAHKSGETTTIVNPDTGEEHDAYSVIIDGITVYFDDTNSTAITDVRELVAGDHIPALLKEQIDTIQIVSEDAPGDPSEIAHESNGNITIFGNREVNAGEIGHEAAHALAEAKWGNAAPPPDSDYMTAINSGEPPLTAYAHTSPGEDFAEGVRLYITNPDRLQEIAPRRYAIINRLMNNRNYNG